MIAGCPPRRQQLTLTGPKDMLLRLDALAAETGQTRPGLLPGAAKLLRVGCEGDGGMTENAGLGQTEREVFHTLHSCGHSVYWTDAAVGMGAVAFPCPWCGGESGHIPPLGTTVVRHGPDVYCIRELNPDGTIELQGEPTGPVVVRHMTGDGCCGAPAPPDRTE